LVLLDVMMPVMDGLTLLGRLRNDPRFEGVPVVLMSSLPESTFVDARALCQQIVRKPFSPRELFEMVERWIAR
jgi:CheY-like chemotaxis protein